MIKPFLQACCFSLFICSSMTPVLAESAALSTALTQNVSVSGKMTEDKFRVLLNQGFRSVIVNRPDQEPGNTVTVYALRNIAEKKQVSVIYQPVQSGKISPTDVTEFARYYHELPKPILMICNSGSRSSQLFHQAKTAGLINE